MQVRTADGDGHADLVTANFTTGASILFGNGDGTFAAAVTISLAATRTVAVGDLNGDGRDDLLLGTGAGGVGATGFVATFFGLVGVLAACCAVQVAMRARQEETHGTAETVLATPVPRVRWLLEYWIVGVAVVVLVLAAAALAAVLGATTASDPGELIRTTLEAAAAQLPACLLLFGVALLLLAWLPRLTIPLGWTILGLTAIVGVFGPILQAPEWVVDLSPFTHSPVPGGDAGWGDAYWMLGIALVAAVVAVASMRRRELASGA